MSVEPGTTAITVVRGNPSADELAAVTAVLALVDAEQAAASAAQAVTPVESAWSAGRRPLRSPLVAGPEQWNRASG